MEIYVASVHLLSGYGWWCGFRAEVTDLREVFALLLKELRTNKQKKMCAFDQIHFHKGHRTQSGFFTPEFGMQEDNKHSCMC